MQMPMQVWSSKQMPHRLQLKASDHSNVESADGHESGITSSWSHKYACHLNLKKT